MEVYHGVRLGNDVGVGTGGMVGLGVIVEVFIGAGDISGWVVENWGEHADRTRHTREKRIVKRFMGLPPFQTPSFHLVIHWHDYRVYDEAATIGIRR